MKHGKNTLAALLVLCLLTALCSCHKAAPGAGYEKENAGGTGYGAGIKSALYIEDFYFISQGIARSQVELLLGSPHYTEEGDAEHTTYLLQNGDSIEFTFDAQKNTLRKADYLFQNTDTADLFEILVNAGALSSVSGEKSERTAVLPGNDGTATPDGKGNEAQQPDVTGKTPVQGDVFAVGNYNYLLIEPQLTVGAPRGSILAAVGKPNSFYSHDFGKDTYILDCYLLNDGSKLYLDYGYGREILRCAAIYKNGSYTSVLGSSWSKQEKPDGFTRPASSKNTVSRLAKNMTPVAVYKMLGEPSWLEGTRGNYKDVFMLDDGSCLYLDFGTAHYRLSSAGIQGADGKVTVVSLNG